MEGEEEGETLGLDEGELDGDDDGDFVGRDVKGDTPHINKDSPFYLQNINKFKKTLITFFAG